MDKKLEADDLDKIYIWELEGAGLAKEERSIDLSPFPDSTIRQDIILTTTYCNLGGVRLWFRCPDCNKRVGTLYVGDYGFSCRHCLNLSYKSKNKNYRSKDYDLLKRFDNYIKANDLIDKNKRYSYAGQPTKKMKKINHLLSNSIFF